MREMVPILVVEENLEPDGALGNINEDFLGGATNPLRVRIVFKQRVLDYTSLAAPLLTARLCHLGLV